MAFDPNKPYEVVHLGEVKEEKKSGFDPGKPYQVVSAPQTLSAIEKTNTLDPGSAVKAKELSSKSGLAFNAVADNLPLVEKEMSRRDWFLYHENAPKATEWLSKDPANYAVAQNDVDRLARLEKSITADNRHVDDFRSDATRGVALAATTWNMVQVALNPWSWFEDVPMDRQQSIAEVGRTIGNAEVSRIHGDLDTDVELERRSKASTPDKLSEEGIRQAIDALGPMTNKEELIFSANVYNSLPRDMRQQVAASIFNQAEFTDGTMPAIIRTSAYLMKNPGIIGAQLLEQLPMIFGGGYLGGAIGRGVGGAALSRFATPYVVSPGLAESAALTASTAGANFASNMAASAPAALAESLAHGKDVDSAYSYAAMSSLGEGAGNAIFSLTPAGMGLLGQAVLQTGQQAAGGAFGAYLGNKFVGEDTDNAELFLEAALEVFAAPGDYAFSLGEQGFNNKVTQHGKDLSAANREYWRTVRILDEVSMSELMQSSPKTLQEFIDTVGDHAIFYADPQAMMNAGVDMEAFLHSVPTAADTINKALETGTFLEIPQGELLVGVAGMQPEQQSAIVRHLATPESPNSLADLEAKGEQIIEEIQAAATQEIDGRENAKELREKQKLIETSLMETMLSAGFDRKNAKPQAQLVSSFYTVMAGRAGVDPVEYFESNFGNLINQPLQDTTRETLERELSLAQDSGINYTESYDANPSQIQSRKADNYQQEQGVFDLQPTSGLPIETAKQQAADNFKVKFKQVGVGSIPVGIDTAATPSEAAHIVAHIRKHAQETMLVIVTDKNNKVISIIRHTKGLKDSSSVSPVEVVGAIANTEGAANVWFAHNHPSESMKASLADVRITQKLVETMDGLDIQYKGHIIVGSGKGKAVTFQYGENDERLVDIEPAPRRKSIELKERVIRKRNTGEVVSIRNQSDAINFVKTLDSDSAIVLLDGAHNVVGTVGMSPEEMSTLREGKRVERLFRALDTTNAAATIIYANDKMAAANVAKFFNGIELRTLDWIYKNEDGALTSDSVLGGGVANTSGVFHHESWQQRARQTGFSEGIKILSTLNRPYVSENLKSHPDYKNAKAGDVAAAVRYVVDMVSDDNLRNALESFGSDVTYVAPTANEATGVNAIPDTLASYYAERTGATVGMGIHQTNKVFHTGASRMERLISRPLFVGDVERGKRYVLVDDVITSGSTLVELANHIQDNGGIVVGLVVLADARKTDNIIPSQKQIDRLEVRFGQELRKHFGITPAALTADEANTLEGIRDAESLVVAGANAAEKRNNRLRSEGISGDGLETSFSIDLNNTGNGVVRGTFNPSTLDITLLKDANLSTFLYEAGHLFLELTFDLASREGANDSLKRDVEIILEWFGLESLDEWGSLSFEEKRVFHEKWAESFEQYLMEGRAPSAELQSAFRTFKRWMIQIYKSLKAFLASNENADLTDEVRQVFDRMLATEQQIERAAMKEGSLPIFDVRPPNMNAEQWDEYKALQMEVLESAKEELLARILRDRKWLQESRRSEIRKIIKAEVEKEVMSEPVYRAWAWLTKTESVDGGGLTKGVPEQKLDIEALLFDLGEENKDLVDRLRSRKMASQKGTQDANEVADQFGYESALQMAIELAEIKLPDQVIAERTEEEMIKRHADIPTWEALEAAADAALYNKAHSRYLATELALLDVGFGKKAVVEKAAKEFAEQIVSEKRNRDLRIDGFKNAKNKANKAALQMWRKGRHSEAAMHKRNELLHHESIKAVYKARSENAKALKFIKNRVASKSAQSKMRGVHRAQLNRFISRFDFRVSKSLKKIDKEAQVSLRDYLTAEYERLSMPVPDLSSPIYDEQFRKHYKDMTVEEFRGVMDVIRQLEALAKREQKVFTAIKKMLFGKEKSVILSHLKERFPEYFDKEGKPYDPDYSLVPSISKKFKAFKERYIAYRLPPETILSILDGGEVGPMHMSYFKRLSDGMEGERVLSKDVSKELKPFFDAYSRLEKAQFATKDIGSKTIGIPITRNDALGVLLLYGNPEGRQRLSNKWNEQTLHQIMGLLDEKDVDLANAIWKMFDETLWPKLEALNKRTVGYSEPKTKAVPFTTSKGFQARGGYFKRKPDNDVNPDYDKFTPEQSMDHLKNRHSMSAKTDQGSSQVVIQDLGYIPSIDALGLLSSTVKETVHDISMREPLLDVWRIINDGDIATSIKVIAGKPVYEVLKKRVGELAIPPYDPKPGDKAMNTARRNVSAALLSGLGTAFQNLTGLLPAMSRVHNGLMLKHIAKVANPLKAKEMYDFMMETSAYMPGRYGEYDRDLLQNAQLMKSGYVDNFLPNVPISWALAPMSLIDLMTTVPVWHAAYEEGLVIHKGNSKVAAERADHIIRETMAAGRHLDLAEVQNHTDVFRKALTMFFSYMARQQALLVRQGALSKRDARKNLPAAVLKMAISTFWVWFAAALVNELGNQAPDDEDDEERIDRLIRAVVLYPTLTFPLGREIFPFIYDKIAGKRTFKPRYSPMSSALETVADTAMIPFDEDDMDSRDVRNIILTAGYVRGVPSILIKDVTEGSRAYMSGETDNPVEILVGTPPGR